ncbi:hypothetical protein [Saccharothrix algeriensis]|uniref:Uncharacterized protein n=1 Tax=Saccharothrix algeriensis TaxID=173560 RepID=A0ABS2SEP0_9PSEU|nr:hypothetical protein [Saccharothrix algeriensis]MBM7814728.1 hypothetical protein [Saccharothrix algeriensis]
MRRASAVLILLIALVTAPEAVAAENPYTATATPSSYVEGDEVLDLTGDGVDRFVVLPFSMMFHGTAYPSMKVADDGYLAFGRLPDGPAPAPGPLPSAAEPNGAVYAFWDDLVIDAEAAVRTKVDGVEPARRFVVEWHNVRRKAEPDSRLSAEVVLHEGGQIVLQYKGIDTPAEAGAHAVVGIEDATGSSALTWSMRQPKLSDATAVRFRVPGTMLVRGVVRNANDGAPIPLADLKTVVNGRPVAMYTVWDGAYRFEVSTRGAVIDVTAEGYPDTRVEVPAGADNTVVVRDVPLAAPALAVGSGPVEIAVPAGQKRTTTATVRNTGGLPGTWDAVHEIEGGTTLPQPDKPGAVLRSWNPVASGVPRGYGIAELDGHVYISSRADGALSRLTPDGVLLGTRRFDEPVGDLAVLRDQGLLCYVAGGPTIKCVRPLTGEVVHSVTGADWHADGGGLAHRPGTDTFFVVDGRTITQVKGPSHADAGAVVGRCGLSRYDQSARIAGIAFVATDPTGGELWIYLVSAGYGRVGYLSRVSPEGCGSRDLMADPMPGAYTGAGLEADPAGNLWVFSNPPYAYPGPTDQPPKVSYLQTGSPVHTPLPWLGGGAPVVVPAGQSRAVEVTVDATSLRPGVHLAALELVTTGPGRPRLGIQVRVVVG